MKRTAFFVGWARCFVLLVPCLLLCLACATPFPFEKLEEGMTETAVRQAVGEPKAIHDEETWTYAHEEWNWWLLRIDYWVVVLRFEDEKLTRWILMDSDGGTRRPPGR